MIRGSKKKPTSVHPAKTVLQVIPVPEIGFNFKQPRVAREIDAMLETGRYIPVIVSTENVPVHDVKQFFKIKSFDDPRVKMYRVPNLVGKSLQEYSQSNLVNRVSYVILNGLSQLLYLLSMMFTLFIATIKENAVIIHVHNPPDLAGIAAIVVSKFTRIPYVFEIHDSTPELFCSNMGLSVDSFAYKILKFQEQLVVKNSSALITVSKSMSAHYEDFAGPKIVIYGGWKAQAENLSVPAERNLRSEYGLIDKQIILYEGKIFSGLYDVDLPLKALSTIFKTHSDATIVYVGDGADKSRLQRLAKGSGLEASVRFTGFVPRSEVFDWIKTSDVAILTFVSSPATKDAVPNKLLEYMAFGKPIVAPKLPGVSEVIKNTENGLLYVPRSAEDLTRCLLSIIEDSALKARIGDHAKQDFVSKYCYEENMPKLISLYDFLSRIPDSRN
jgi:glycosyltransferase involved in cell wall biosynthesis